MNWKYFSFSVLSNKHICDTDHLNSFVQVIRCSLNLFGSSQINKLVDFKQLEAAMIKTKGENTMQFKILFFFFFFVEFVIKINCIKL